MEQILTVSTMAMLVLELVKYLVRFIMKDPNYNFSKMFYALTLPVLHDITSFTSIGTSAIGISRYCRGTTVSRFTVLSCGYSRNPSLSASL
jgi:hypothetical protein